MSTPPAQQTPTPQTTAPASDGSAKPRRRFGVGAVLITVYAILAIGATSRAVYQTLTVYTHAPVPITLSAVSGLIYIVATLALILPGRAWYRIAWVTISFELLGVLVIGTLSTIGLPVFAASEKISDGTVWSNFGIGYVYIPVVLPILGLLWLRSRRALYAPAASESAEH